MLSFESIARCSFWVLSLLGASAHAAPDETPWPIQQEEKKLSREFIFETRPSETEGESPESHDKKNLPYYYPKFRESLPEGAENLKTLRLQGFQIKDSIPSYIYTLTNLKTLQLGGNRLQNTLSEEIGNLENLEKVYLYGNCLTGEIPHDIGKLSRLKVLLLHDNQLTGSIPSEISNLRFLEMLCLEENQLTGEIPPAVFELTNLKHLNLSENEFTGEIPKEIGNLRNAKYIYLNSNKLTGNIPESIITLWSLESLYLQDNYLCSSDSEGNFSGQIFEKIIEFLSHSRGEWVARQANFLEDWRAIYGKYRRGGDGYRADFLKDDFKEYYEYKKEGLGNPLKFIVLDKFLNKLNKIGLDIEDFKKYFIDDYYAFRTVDIRGNCFPEELLPRNNHLTIENQRTGEQKAKEPSSSLNQ